MKNLILLCLSIILLNFIHCSEDSSVNPPPAQNQKGKLVVKSNPPGARIYLMGTDTGKNTPDSLLDLEPDIYDLFLYLQYYDTAYFSVKIIENLTTSKEITLQDGLPFVDILLDYFTVGDSVRFSMQLNQDVLMDSIIVERPINSSGVYVTNKYIYNKELFEWEDQLGNPIKYFLPPSDAGYHYYQKISILPYYFNFYGQKAHGAKTYFHINIDQMFN